MKLVLYGSFPASEAGRISRYLTSRWEVIPVLNEAPAEEKRQTLADAQVMVTSVYRSRDPPAPELRLLQCSSTGVERIDLKHLPPGCLLSNVHGHEIAMAEYTICAVLDWAIGYRALAAAFRDGTWTLAEWVAALDGIDTCFAPVNTLEETLADPQVKALNLVSSGQINPPFAMSRTPAKIRRPPPKLGEHTAEILAELEND